MAQTLQADIAGDERAIRHLLGEKKALESKEARVAAQVKMARARLRNADLSELILPPVLLAGTDVKVAVDTIPHGMRFPDLSSYQPHVALETVRVDKSIRVGSLAVFKATEGLGYTDGYFVARWKQAQALEFPFRGAYHFLHPDLSGEEQALYFLAEIDRAGGATAQDILIADVEVTDGQSPATVANCTAQFGSTLAKESPAKRWLYTGGPFAKECGLVLPPYQGHWLPAYVTDPRPYYVFGTPIAWQYTDGVHGPTPNRVAGVGPCDVSVIL